MKNIFSLSDTLTNKISFYHLVLFLAALPFDQFYSEVVFISFILHTLIHCNWKLDFLRHPEFYLLISVFLVTIVFTAFSDNQQEAFRLWVRQLGILLFPFCFFLSRFDYRKYEKAVFLSFAFVCTFAVGYLYIDAFRIIQYHHLPPSALFSPLFMNHSFAEPLDIHATYLSLYVYTALVTVIHYFLSEKNRIRKLCYLVCGLILLPGLIQLGSRAVLIAFFVTLCIVFPFGLEAKNRLRFLLVAFLVIGITALSVVKVESFKTRFLHELQNDLTKTPATQDSNDSRMERWSVAFPLVKKSPLIGFGTGDEVDLLKQEYFNHKLYDAYLNNLNAHNQYLSFLLTGGVVGLAAFLVTLLWGIRLAIRSKNVLFLSFLIVLIFVSVSENLLERNKGIFFYGFFFSYFVAMERTKSKPSQGSRQFALRGNPKKAAYVYTKEH